MKLIYYFLENTSLLSFKDGFGFLTPMITPVPEKGISTEELFEQYLRVLHESGWVALSLWKRFLVKIGWKSYGNLKKMQGFFDAPILRTEMLQNGGLLYVLVMIDNNR